MYCGDQYGYLILITDAISTNTWHIFSTSSDSDTESEQISSVQIQYPLCKEYI